jgi:predicted regulator of Ras-like GTPase activity (Roadblock/LC7/MglB family)
VSNVHWETATMAELYLKQGQRERAIAIYRHVVRERPDDVVARRRLSELEGSAKTNEEGPMGFREHIQRVVDQTPGALACCVMGFDGIAIDSYEVGGAEIDMSTLFAEYASAAHQLRRAFDDASTAGVMSELMVSSEKFTTVVRPITGEYFIAAIMKPDAVFGKARYLLRLAAPKLATELS